MWSPHAGPFMTKRAGMFFIRTRTFLNSCAVTRTGKRAAPAGPDCTAPRAYAGQRRPWLHGGQSAALQRGARSMYAPRAARCPPPAPAPALWPPRPSPGVSPLCTAGRCLHCCLPDSVICTRRRTARRSGKRDAGPRLARRARALRSILHLLFTSACGPGRVRPRLPLLHLHHFPPPASSPADTPAPRGGHWPPASFWHAYGPSLFYLRHRASSLTASYTRCCAGACVIAQLASDLQRRGLPASSD